MAKKQVFKEAALKIQAAQDVIKKLETFYTKIEDLERVARAINFRVIEKLNPVMRSMVIANYPEGNIKEKTGELMRAVSASYLSISKEGILKVNMGRNFDKKVYVRAGVFRKFRDWYELSSSQKNELMNRFTDLFIKEVNAWIERMAKSSGL